MGHGSNNASHRKPQYSKMPDGRWLATTVTTHGFCYFTSFYCFTFFTF